MTEKYLELIDEQIQKLSSSDKDFDFEIWQYETINILSEIFGKESPQIEQLKSIKFNWGGLGVGDSFHSWDNLKECISKSETLLKSFIEHIKKFEVPKPKNKEENNEKPLTEGRDINSEKRLALVIGNSKYQKTTALPNPVNDADEMEKLLQGLNFKVHKYHDLNWQDLKRAVEDFGEELKGHDVSLIFYAGHGLQVNGKNFLVPVEFELISEKRVEYECVDAGWILAVMEDADVPVNILILDACRDNPFSPKTGRSVNIGRGLASMNAPSGTIIAYATAPGDVADDGVGKNGLYTEALLSYLPLENILIEQVFKRTRKDVMTTSRDEQIPWESTSLTGDFYMNKK